MNALALMGAAAAVAGIDQVSKRAVLRRLVGGRRPVLGRWLSLRKGLNHRAGLVPLSITTAVALWLALVACLAVLLALGSPGLGTAQALGIGLLTGGAASNLGDRLVRGAVVDFIDLGWRPTFNVADAAMVTGACLAAWGLI